MKNPTIIRVNATVHKRTFKSRIDFASVLGALAGQSSFYNAEPELQTAGGAVIQAGADLADAEAAANAAAAAAIAAAGARDAMKLAFDQRYGVFTATVEKHAQTPDDLNSIGFDELQRKSYPLTAPLSVTATFDPMQEHIDIDVKQAPGMLACFIEISPDPAGPATWKRLPGIAATRSLGGYAPGTYWVRAVSTRGEEESGFTGPVSVIVK